MTSLPRLLGAGVASALAAAAALPAAPAVAAPPSSGTASIYVSLPRQGANASSTRLIERGLRAALAAHGGVAGGQRIRLVALDDADGARWSPRRVRANARRAAADPKALAYVGELNSEATAVAAPILARAGLPEMAPISTADALTRPAAGSAAATRDKTLVRPVPSDRRQAVALVSYLRRAHVRRVALVDDGALYGRSLATTVARLAPRAGIRVALRRTADRDGRGRAGLVRAVAASKPRAVLFAGSLSSGAAPLFRALHAALPRALLFGGDALAHDAFARAIGGAQRVVRLTAPSAHVDRRDPRARPLGYRPDAVTVFAYNGMTAVLDAIDRAAARADGGRPTRAAVRAALFDGTLQRGLAGPWTIDARGDSTYAVFDALRLRGGRVVEPIEQAALRELRRDRRRRDGRRTARTSGSSVTAVGGLGAILLSGMDIETALTMVQQQRSRLLDELLRDQLEAVQRRNTQIAALDARLVAVRALLGGFAADAPAQARLDATAAWSSDPDAGATAAQLAGAADPSAAELGLGAAPGAWTRGQLEAAARTLVDRIDALSGSQQLDMLRLQSLTNKRNEAFDLMTAFVKKMQDSRSSIVGSMR